jgi:hypothetical protein
LEPVEPLLAALSAGPQLVESLLADVPMGLLKVRPAKGWSLHEHAVHVTRVDELMAERSARMLAEVDPVIEGVGPSPEEEAGANLEVELASSLARWHEVRAATLTRLAALTPAQWTRSARHEEYEHYTVFTMHRHLLLHEQLHMFRMEELSLERVRLAELKERSA